MKLQALLPRTREARELLISALRLCAVMLFCSWLLLIRAGEILPDTYSLCRLSGALQTEACAVLLLGNIGALLEEFFGQ